MISPWIQKPPTLGRGTTLTNFSPIRSFPKKPGRLLIIALILVVAIGIIITVETAHSRDLELRESLITQVRLASVGLDPAQVSSLSSQQSGSDSREYHDLKRQMEKIASSHKLYRFAYLLRMNPEGTVNILVDSEEPGSKSYSPPGQEYTEAPPAVREVFLTGRDITLGPYSDRWGTFVSGYIPLNYPGSDNTPAVLGIDIEVGEWNQEVMTAAVIPALLTMLLVTVLISLIIINQYSEKEEKGRAESEEQLRRSEERLREAQRNAKIGIFEYYPGSGDIRCSQETYDILGIGQTESDKLSALIRTVFRDKDPGIKTEISSGGIVVKMDLTNGQALWLNIIGKTDLTGDEDGIRIHGTIQDITELHYAQENLSRDKERLRLLIRNSSDIISVMDKDKVYRYVSESIERVIGYKPEDYLNKQFTPQMIYPDDYTEASRLLEELIATPGGQRRLVFRHRHKTDGYVYLETIGTNLLDDPVINGIILNSRDFSEIKKSEERLLISLEEIRERNRDLEDIRAQMIRVNDGLEERVCERTRDLEESKEQIEQLLIQKDQFIYQLAHDLRTPLTPVVAMLPLLIIGITDPDSKTLLEIFNKSIQYLQKMVEDILLYSQLNRQYSITDYAEYSLQDLMNDAVEYNSFPAEQKDITFIWDIPDDIIVRLSKSHAQQLFRNLINNAVKYNNMNGTVTISAMSEHNGVTVKIKDTGIGITADLMDKIWDEFTTGDSARRDPEAKGLGLPIVRRIVVLHGGTIHCFSEGTGKGATFTLFLPNFYNSHMNQDILDRCS